MLHLLINLQLIRKFITIIFKANLYPFLRKKNLFSKKDMLQNNPFDLFCFTEKTRHLIVLVTIFRSQSSFKNWSNCRKTGLRSHLKQQNHWNYHKNAKKVTILNRPQKEHCMKYERRNNKTEHGLFGAQLEMCMSHDSILLLFCIPICAHACRVLIWGW